MSVEGDPNGTANGAGKTSKGKAQKQRVAKPAVIITELPYQTNKASPTTLINLFPAHYGRHAFLIVLPECRQHVANLGTVYGLLSSSIVHGLRTDPQRRDTV